jgi:transposase
MDETLRFDSGALHLASRGGKQARNKAVVAVARKLAILLHHLWTTQATYMPFYERAA